MIAHDHGAGQPMMKIEFASVHEYGRQFTDITVWRRAIEWVCQRHNIAITTMHAGLAGTHPVFLVQNGQQYVIKFYETQFFSGTRSYWVEHELYQWLPSALPIAIPRLLGSGTLEDSGTWPYIITSVIPGTSFGEVRPMVGTADTTTLAIMLGNILAQLHRIPVQSAPFLVELRNAFGQFINRQYELCVANHRQWNTLPAHLIAQIPRYLAAHEHFYNPLSACLIHADLTHDHVLGEFQDGKWRMTGLIDFGDAWVGDPIYELVALHLSIFQLDRQLLKTFLAAYTLDSAVRNRFVKRAMLATLLFEFNSFKTIVQHRPTALEAATLDELANNVWNIS